MRPFRCSHLTIQQGGNVIGNLHNSSFWESRTHALALFGGSQSQYLVLQIDLAFQHGDMSTALGRDKFRESRASKQHGHKG